MKAEALLDEMRRYGAFLIGTDKLFGKPVPYTYLVMNAHFGYGSRSSSPIHPRVSKKIVDRMLKEGKLRRPPRPINFDDVFPSCSDYLVLA